MIKLLVFPLCCLFSLVYNLGELSAQGVPPPDDASLYEQGVIYLKVKNSSDVQISYVPGEPNKSTSETYPIFTTYQVRKVSRPFEILGSHRLERVYRIHFNRSGKEWELMEALQKITFVELVERVPVKTTYDLPPVTLDDPVQGYHLTRVNAFDAFSIHQGGNAIVAVVDDAVLRTHEDLVANITAGWDVADLDNNTDPPFSGPAAAAPFTFSHGTHVSGIAGGRNDNATGVASLGFDNQIMPVKSNYDGTFNPAQLNLPYDGVAWAAANGAHVINMSWGGEGYSQVEYMVIEDARYLFNVILVAAAGNEGKQKPTYPSAYGEGTTGQAWEANDRRLVISVAALDQSDHRSIWGINGSNYGPWVDVSAYGTNITSSVANSLFGGAVNNTYQSYNGTSMASPMVAGLAGLMVSYKPLATDEDIIDCLLGTANPDIYHFIIHPGNLPGTLGSGRIDALKALQCLKDDCADYLPVAIIVPSATVICGGGGTVNLSANSGIGYQWSEGSTTQAISVSAGGTYSVTVTFDAGCTASASVEIYEGIVTPVVVPVETSGIFNDGIICVGETVALQASGGFSYLWSTTETTSTIHVSPIANQTYSVTITDAYGCTAAASVAIQVDASCPPDEMRKLFGDADDNFSTNVKMVGNHLYVTGYRQVGTGLPVGTFSKFDLAGNLLWTVQMDLPSTLLDFTDLADGSGFFVVGRSEPYTAVGAGVDNQSLLAKIDNSGNVLWAKYYDQLDRETFSRIIRHPNPLDPAFPYYVVGQENEAMGATHDDDDLLLFNLDLNGDLNWRHQYGTETSADDDLIDVLLPLPNGNLWMMGKWRSHITNNTLGTALQTDGNGTTVQGVQLVNSFSIHDARRKPTGEFLLCGMLEGGQGSFLTKTDANLAQLWALKFPTVSRFDWVDESSTGGIYALGYFEDAGVTKPVVFHVTELGGSPQLEWIRLLENGETAFGAGCLRLTADDRILYADNRQGNLFAIGGWDVMLGLFDSDFSTLCLSDTLLATQNVLLPPTPIPFPVVTEPLPTALTQGGSALPYTCTEPCQEDLLSCETVTCTTDSLSVNTGVDHLAGMLYPYGVYDAYWTLCGSPDAGVGVPRPAFVIEANEAWNTLFKTRWLSAYPQAERTQNNCDIDPDCNCAAAQAGACTPDPYVFKNCFCVCDDDSEVIIDVELLADDMARMYLTREDGTIVQHLVSGFYDGIGSFPFQDSVHVRDTFVLPKGKYCLQVELWNVGGVVMGFDVQGWIKGAASIKQECCDPNGAITGAKFHDINCNGVWDFYDGQGDKPEKEPGVEGWTIQLCDADGNLVATTVTDVFGYYAFTGVPPGNYTVKEVAQPDWVSTFPASGVHAVMLEQLQVAGFLDFGNKFIGELSFRDTLECVTIGYEQAITWQGGECECDVSITLINCETMAVEVIEAMVDNNGTYYWTPSSLLPEGNYQIVISTLPGPGCTTPNIVSSPCFPLVYGEPPTVTCPPSVTIDCADADGFMLPAAVFTHDCPCDSIPVKLIPTNYFGPYPCGTSEFEVSIEDDCGKAACTVSVTVEDNEPPVVTCNSSITLALDGTGMAVLTPGMVGSWTDNCDVTASLSQSVFDCSDACKEAIEVTLTVKDCGDNESDCATLVLVLDEAPPVVICPPTYQAGCLAETNPFVTGFAFATDNCSVASLFFTDVISGSIPCDGNLLRTWTATDSCSNSSNCLQLIIVADQATPILDCPDDVTVSGSFDANGICGADVMVSPANATDNCSAVIITSDHPGSFFSEGTTTVTWTATDACGNLATCTVDVTVNCNKCDSIEVTSEPSPVGTDSCCFILQLDNKVPDCFTGIQLCAEGSVSISTVSTFNGWIINGYGATYVGLTKPGFDLPVLDEDFVKICLSNYSTGMQQVVVKYFDQNFKVVCYDTLSFNCSQQPKCVKALTDTVFCGPGNDFTWQFDVMSNPLIGWNVGSISINAPSGITVSPQDFSIPSLPPGGSYGTLSTVISGGSGGDVVCFSVTAHKQDITEGEPPTDCCTDTVMQVCITLPVCDDPCDSVWVEALPVVSETDCCWNIVLHNNYDPNYFTGVVTEIITPGVDFTALCNFFGSGWYMDDFTLPYSSSNVLWDMIPPQGSFIGAMATLPKVCLGDIDAGEVPQQVVVHWLAEDSVVCMDTLVFDCGPPDPPVECAEVVNASVECAPGGGYAFTFQVQNLSGHTATDFDLANVTPAGSISPTAFMETIPDGSVSASHTVSVTGGAGDLICFQVNLHQIDGAGNNLNCCLTTVPYCITLPPCDDECCNDQEAFCEKFEDGFSVQRFDCGVQLTPRSLDDCQQVLVTWGDGETTGPVAGGVPISHLYSASGDFGICVTVQELTLAGEVCFVKDTCFMVCVECDTCSNPSIVSKWTKFPATSPVYNNGSDSHFFVSPASNGDFYATGSFRGTFSGTTLNNASGTDDGFVVKYDNTGAIATGFLPFSFGGNGNDVGTLIKDDGAGGFYLAGLYTQDCTIPSPSGLSMPVSFSDGTETIKPDAFLAHFDANQTLTWAVNINAFDAVIEGLSFLPNGDIVVSGNRTGQAVFGSWQSGGTSVMSTGNTIFVAYYSSAGMLQDVKTFSEYGIALGVSADAVGNVYLAGDFASANLLFEGTIATGISTNNVLPRHTPFVAKLNANRQYDWGFAIRAVTPMPGLDNYASAWDVEQNSNGVYVVGSSSSDVGLIDYDPKGTGTLHQYSGGGNFLARYNAETGVCECWTNLPTQAGGYELELDENGQAFLTGDRNIATMFIGIYNKECQFLKSVEPTSSDSPTQAWSVTPIPHSKDFAVIGRFVGSFDADPLAGDGDEFAGTPNAPGIFVGEYTCVCPGDSLEDACCDKLNVSAIPNPVVPGCCYSVNLTNTAGFDVTKIEALLLGSDWSFGSVAAGSGLSETHTLNSIVMTNPVTPFVLPSGTLAGALQFCLDDLTSTAASPQILVFNWYETLADGMERIACSDTVYLDCDLSFCVVDFSSTDLGCGDFTFNSFATMSGGGTISYQWDFGGAGTSNDANPAFTFPSPGSYNVCLTVSNGSVSCEYCQPVVVAFDNSQIVLQCPNNEIWFTDPGACWSNNDPFPTGAIILHQSPCADGGLIGCNRSDGQPLFAPFPAGTTTINCFAADEFGTTTCSSTINVIDVEPPFIFCPEDTCIFVPPGTSSIVVNYVPAPWTLDNCFSTLTCTPPSGSTFPVGVTPVNCTAIDLWGNTASCSFNVEVKMDTCLVDAFAIRTGYNYAAGTFYPNGANDAYWQPVSGAPLAAQSLFSSQTPVAGSRWLVPPGVFFRPRDYYFKYCLEDNFDCTDLSFLFDVKATFNAEFRMNGKPLVGSIFSHGTLTQGTYAWNPGAADCPTFFPGTNLLNVRLYSGGIAGTALSVSGTVSSSVTPPIVMQEDCCPPLPQGCSCDSVALATVRPDPRTPWNRCTRRFNVSGATDCDMLTWRVNGTVVGTTFGNASFTYTFPSTFTPYNVEVTLKRTTPTGQMCTKKFMFTVRCTRIFEWEDIPPGGVIKNAGFAENTAEGFFGAGGASPGWSKAFGDPYVMGDSGAVDSNFVILSGSASGSDAIQQELEVPLDAATLYSLRLVGRHFFPKPPNTNTRLVIRASKEKQFETVCEGECDIVAVIDTLPADTLWDAFETTWVSNAAYKYLTIHVENDLDEGGEPSNRSYVALDKIILEWLSGTGEPSPAKAIRLFPNPTTGRLTLRFSAPSAPGTEVEIADVWGRVVERKVLPPGATEHSLSLAGMPSGVYFIKILENGEPVWVEKIVKQ